MNLEEMVARYDGGVASSGTIEGEILSHFHLYQKPDLAASESQFHEWADRCSNLAQTLDWLTDHILRKENAASVYGTGWILVNAAKLLNPFAFSKANYQVGMHLATLKAYKQAVGFLERATESAEGQTEESRSIQLSAALNQLVCLERLGRFGDMKILAERLLKDHHSEQNLTEARVLEDLGLAHEGLSNHELAIEAFGKALRIQEKLAESGEGNDVALARISLSLGWTARSAGRFELALSAFENGRTFALSSEMDDFAAILLSEIGITWVTVGEVSRGREILESAAIEADKLGKSEDAARWRAKIGTQGDASEADSVSQQVTLAAALLRESPPNTSEARRIARRCVRLVQKQHALEIEAEARNCVAVSHSLERNYYQALLSLRVATRLAVDLNNKSMEFRFRTNLGLQLTKLSQLTDAEGELRTAIKLGMEVRNSAQTMELRQAITGGLTNAYDNLAMLLSIGWTRDGKVVQSAREEKLIELAQEAHAANFATWMALENDVEQQGSEELSKLLLSLRAAEVSLEMSSLVASTEIAPLLKQQTLLRAQFKDSASQLGLHVDFAPPLFSAHDLSQFLQPGHCLVDLYPTQGEAIIITILGREGSMETSSIRWPGDERNNFLQRWKTKVFSRSDADFQKSRFRGVRGESHRTEARLITGAAHATPSSLLEELDQRFIKKLAALLRAAGPFESITVIPHRELSLIPYWALSSHLPDACFSVVPGTNVYKLLKERHIELAGPRLALGDFTGSLSHVPDELDHLPGFVALPYSIDAIIEMLTAANMVHMACHGEFNEKNPYRSGLVAEPVTSKELRPYGARTLCEEELLTVAEVLAKGRLTNCYLAVLSACCTGLPRQHAASEYIGLPAAFLIAGATNVIASLWPVYDGATYLLMQEFYGALFQNGEKARLLPSRALATARTKLSRISRQEVIDRLGPEAIVPECEFPYAGPEYTFAFQHFGIN